MKKRVPWMVQEAPRPSAPGIPCGLASLARVPLRFAKGRERSTLRGGEGKEHVSLREGYKGMR